MYHQACSGCASSWIFSSRNNHMLRWSLQKTSKLIQTLKLKTLFGPADSRWICSLMWMRLNKILTCWVEACERCQSWHRPQSWRRCLCLWAQGEFVGACEKKTEQNIHILCWGLWKMSKLKTPSWPVDLRWDCSCIWKRQEDIHMLCWSLWKTSKLKQTLKAPS